MTLEFTESLTQRLITHLLNEADRTKNKYFTIQGHGDPTINSLHAWAVTSMGVIFKDNDGLANRLMPWYWFYSENPIEAAKNVEIEKQEALRKEQERSKQESIRIEKDRLVELLTIYGYPDTWEKKSG